jgi:type IV pilus assembly protein PilW
VGTPDDDLVINVTNNINAVAGDFLLLSDCDKADLVRVCTSAASTTPANSLNLTLSSTCATGPTYIADRALLTGPGATVQKLAGTVFYVGKRGDTATNVPALFRRTLGTLGTAGTPEELVEGIENMQILYGENIDNDNNNAVDRFVPADQVTNWDKVVSVRIELLVMSLENNLVPAAQPYTYNGIDYTGASGKGALPPDTRLRRVFTTTINLRNITLGG